jgi:2-phospho-L-lactate/phosphoenolpyruvate guanylyltransferase
MHAALLPVKALASAKGRLGAAISAAEREALTRAMLADMIEALASARCLDRTYVLSADAEVLRAGAELGAATLREDLTKSNSLHAQRAISGLNRAVADAAECLAVAGVTRLLTIPGDVPLIEPDDVEALFRVDGSEWPVVLVPSGSGTGTNGLLLSPPTAIVPRFEGASLIAHMEACREQQVAFRVLELPSFALDVDTPEDLAELTRRGRHRRSGRVVVANRTAA